MIVVATFVDDVMRELVVALGGALFVGNLLALFRRRPGRDPAEEGRQGGESPPPARAPAIRTIVYMLIGFVVMVWGIASLAVS